MMMLSHLTPYTQELNRKLLSQNPSP